MATGCSPEDPSSTGTTGAAAAAGDAAAGSSTVPDYAELADEMAPLAAPLGWEVQRAYRQDAYLVGRDVDLVNVYLRPIGTEPTPDQYLADATKALQAIVSAHVFASDANVTADPRLPPAGQRRATRSDVAPAIRILGLRDDLAPLVESPVELTDLVSISRDRRLVLLLDDYVQQAPGWAQALADSTSTTGG